MINISEAVHLERRGSQSAESMQITDGAMCYFGLLTIFDIPIDVILKGKGYVTAPRFYLTQTCSCEDTSLCDCGAEGIAALHLAGRVLEKDFLEDWISCQHDVLTASLVSEYAHQLLTEWAADEHVSLA